MKRILVTLSLLCSLQLFASLKICKDLPKNTAYLAYIKDLNKFNTALSNHKEIASKSDKMLSKLLTAKSPVIINWISSRKLSKEVEIVKAWRQYYLEQFVLNNFKKTPINIKKIVNAKANALYKKHLPLNIKKQYIKDFKVAKKKGLEFIKTNLTKNKDKIKLLTRISNIELNFTYILENSRLKNKPLDVLKWTLNYDPVPNKINVGLQSLKYINSINRIAIFSHEIAHSYDPCRYPVFISKTSPFLKVATCLRKAHSAQAKKRDDSLLKTYLKTKRISKNLYLALKLNPFCNKQAYPPLGTQKEQINEIFADWVSAEIISTLTKDKLEGFRLDLCRNNSLNAGSSYISNASRLKLIYLAQPQLKKLFYPQNKALYCSPKL